VFWGLWHLPLFLLVPGYNGAGIGFVGILIHFVAFVITWVFNNTLGSIGLSILLHASINTAPTMLLLSLFPSLRGALLLLLSLLLAWIVVAVLIIAATPGRLSYQRYLWETSLPTPLTDREQEKGEVRMSV
jgi:CAAX protease family protein